MKVKLLTSIASVDWSYGYGELVNVPDELARKWISSGIAAPAEAQVESAAIEPPEKAVLPRGKPRKAGRHANH